MNNREKILAAAKVEFAKKGFHGSLVSDIAERAGVGKGTIYNYFSNKEDLFGSIIKEQMKNFENRIAKLLSQPGEVRELLHGVAQIHFDEFYRSKEVIEILVMEGLNKIGSVKEDFKKGILNIRDMVATLLDRGVERGEVRVVDTKKVALIYLGLLWTILKHCIVLEENDPDKRYGEVIEDVFFFGIIRNIKDK